MRLASGTRESTSELCVPHISSRLPLLQTAAFLQGLISNILDEDVVQPLLVSTSAVELSTETICLLLKIDDYVQAR
jgi:hypothetical protein